MDSWTNATVPTPAMYQSQLLRGADAEWGRRSPRRMPLNTGPILLSDSLIIKNTSDAIVVSQCVLPGRRKRAVGK